MRNFGAVERDEQVAANIRFSSHVRKAVWLSFLDGQRSLGNLAVERMHHESLKCCEE